MNFSWKAFFLYAQDTASGVWILNKITLILFIFKIGNAACAISILALNI